MNIIILSVLEILIGILLLVDPEGLTQWIVLVFGILAIIAGVINIVQYFRMSAEEAALKKSLVVGILALLVGIWCVARREWFIGLFPLLTTLYGVAILVSGVAKVQWTADMIRLKIGKWGWMAASAIITLVCAVIILAHPFTSTVVLWVFIGVSMIVEAVIDILAAIFKKQGSITE